MSIVSPRPRIAGLSASRRTTGFFGLALTVGLLTLLTGCPGECFGGSEARGASHESAIVLDAAHPLAEQAITVHVNAAALPATGTKSQTLTVTVRPADRETPRPSITEPGSSTGRTPPAGSGPVSARPSAEPGVLPQVTIIRADGGAVVPTAAPGTANWTASVALDCVMAADCDQAYRIRVTAPGLDAARHLSLTWVTSVSVTYEGVADLCGVPSGARISVDSDDPVALAAADTAFADPVARDEAPATLVSRHVTVSSDGTDPIAASMRLTLRPVPPGKADETWHTWVRVVADGATTPVASALVGPDGYGGPDGGILDIPVLGDCAAGAECKRGYWIVFQNFAVAPVWAGWGPDIPPPNLGQLTWSVSATAAHAGDDANPRLKVTIDDLAADASGPVVEGAAPEVTLRTNKVPTVVEAVFTIPDRPVAINGLDPLAASVAIVHMQGSGVALVARLDGDGAGPLTGYANGDGTRNLIAHPFDGCPPTGACTARLRLIGTFHVEEHGSQADSATVSWSVTILGAPEGTTVAFGDPYEER